MVNQATRQPDNQATGLKTKEKAHRRDATLNLRGGGGFVIITNLEIITIMCKISTSYGVNLLTGAGGGA